MLNNPHVPRKYTFKKRLPKLHGDGMSEKNFHSIVPNGLNGGTEKHFNPAARSKNSSPVFNTRPEKYVKKLYEVELKIIF